MRVAFTLIGGKQWFGGYNYQLNLFKAITNNEKSRIQICLFLGRDVSDDLLTAFKEIPEIEIIRSMVFNKNNISSRLIKSVVFGKDDQAFAQFNIHNIDIVFEVANYYGWRFPIPTVAWMPDFQHRHLRHMFGFFSFWKRDIGFRMQIMTNRLIMLSSEDARNDCERFYPKSSGRAHVVRFAVPYKDVGIDHDELLKLYGLQKPFFFLPNQFWKHKNHACVIEALKICMDRGDNIAIAASGKQEDSRDEGYFPHILNLLSTNELNSNFRLLGVIPYTHIQVLMKECTAVINPSHFEGWSTTVEEAKSYGKAMILSDIDVHKEQALGSAVFFNADKPEELADILSHFKVKGNSNSEKNITLIKKASLVKVKKYANEFVDLMTIAHNQK